MIIAARLAAYLLSEDGSVSTEEGIPGYEPWYLGEVRRFGVYEGEERHTDEIVKLTSMYVQHLSTSVNYVDALRSAGLDVLRPQTAQYGMELFGLSSMDSLGYYDDLHNTQLYDNIYRFFYRLYPIHLPPDKLIAELAVPLSGLDRCVAKHDLQGRQASTPLQPLAGKGVPQLRQVESVDPCLLPHDLCHTA